MPSDEGSAKQVRVIVLMGVAGAGKTTVGSMVAARLGVPFYDADDFHDPASVDLMRSGIALNDEQRGPWLLRLNELLRDHQVSGAVLACSALKRSYRAALRDRVADLVFVQLAVDPLTLEQRLGSRAGHYAGPALLASQLATLEGGDDIIVINGERPPEKVADEVVRVSGR